MGSVVHWAHRRDSHPSTVGLARHALPHNEKWRNFLKPSRFRECRLAPSNFFGSDVSRLFHSEATLETNTQNR
jgi:hypothetical protein